MFEEKKEITIAKLKNNKPFRISFGVIGGDMYYLNPKGDDGDTREVPVNDYVQQYINGRLVTVVSERKEEVKPKVTEKPKKPETLKDTRERLKSE